MNIMDLIRRLVYGINMIIFYHSPYIQVVINSSISFSTFIFMILYQPYKKRLDNILNIYIEFNTFCILSAIGAFIYEDLPSYLYNISVEIAIIMIYLIIILPAIVNITISIQNFILWLRRRNKVTTTLPEQTRWAQSQID